VEQSIPTITVRQHLDKPWMNNSIRKLLAERQSALRDIDTITTKRLQTTIQHSIRYAKRSLAHKIDNKFKSNTKSAWTNLNSLLNLTNKHVECSANPDTLNTFFARFERPSDVRSYTPDAVDYNVTDFFSFDMVYKVLYHVNVSKSCGPDRISAKLIKTVADCLAQPICTLFNNSLKTSTMPALWKTAAIKPIPKIKGASEPKDYRTIELTPILAKCFEKLILPHITDKLSDQS
jgi:hypothetical protein